MEATRPRSSRMEGRSPRAIDRSSATVSSTVVRMVASDGGDAPTTPEARSSESICRHRWISVWSGPSWSSWAMCRRSSS